MSRWILSEHAAEDLIDIYVYTYREFGAPQAERYTEEIEEKFSILAESPALGRQLSEIPGTYRCTVSGRHVIIYRIQGEDIFIVRVLHGRQDIARIARGEESE